MQKVNKVNLICWGRCFISLCTDRSLQRGAELRWMRRREEPPPNLKSWKETFLSHTHTHTPEMAYHFNSISSCLKPRLVARNLHNPECEAFIWTLEGFSLKGRWQLRKNAPSHLSVRRRRLCVMFSEGWATPGFIFVIKCCNLLSVLPFILELPLHLVIFIHFPECLSTLTRFLEPNQSEGQKLEDIFLLHHFQTFR